MKKIKRFRINLRSREILRLLKKTTDITEIDSEIEDKVEKETRRLQKSIFPAAIYETIPKDKLPNEITGAQPETWVAATAYLVTVGEGIEKELSEKNIKNDKNSEMIIHTVALEGVEQSVNFIERLIREEASKEDCEISKEYQLSSQGDLAKLFGIISGEKVGISLSEQGHLNPLYSSSGIIYWMPVRKRRK